MPFDLAIPQPNGASLDLTINEGESLFILGANGTGKSSLMHNFFQRNRQNAKRLTAHRQTWLESNLITLSPQDKRNAENTVVNFDNRPEARWSDSYSHFRPSIAIYDLVDAENARARAVTRAVDEGNVDDARRIAKQDAPIKVINELLRISNIPIEISVEEDNQLLARKSGSAPYSIAELSDGERNALLIASSVLTAKPGT